MRARLPAFSIASLLLAAVAIDPAAPSDTRTAKGLREALRVGSTNAVSRAGVVDGYFRNEAIKILMPEKLRPVDRALRTIGLGARVDEFVLSMNRAAEKAAPAAKEIFLGAIKELTFDDVRRILGGGDTAATEYFRSKTADRLTVAFQPAVHRAMGETGVTRQYEDLSKRYEKLPLVHGEAFDIDAYVVSKALDGLFVVLGEEERKIRTDPAARITTLLRETFGRPPRP